MRQLKSNIYHRFQSRSVSTNEKNSSGKNSNPLCPLSRSGQSIIQSRSASSHFQKLVNPRATDDIDTPKQSKSKSEKEINEVLNTSPFSKPNIKSLQPLAS